MDLLRFSSLNESVFLLPISLMFSGIYLTVGSHFLPQFRFRPTVQAKTQISLDRSSKVKKIPLKYKTCLIFVRLIAVFFFIVMLSTAEQPQEKVFAGCEVFRGWSYLGKVQPKTMVAVWGDRWPHSGNLSQSERWAWNILDFLWLPGLMHLIRLLLIVWYASPAGFVSWMVINNTSKTW